MKNVFNFKLYLEGLKKIKLVGIIVGIVTIVLNALVPLVNLINVTQYEHDLYGQASANLIDASEFSIPLILILFLTPFFFLSMFSFLNKRNESDFYHAIPYKRACVFGSFTAAIYTWIFAIIIASTAAAAFLWWINPTTTFSFALIPMTIGVYAVGALYIGGFILLAMTLSGTTVSNIAVAIIALFSFRIIGALITVTLEELVPMFDIAYSAGKIFSFRYWLPAAIISSFFDTAVYSDAFLWGYSAIVTVGVYALAAYCYCTRKSESAGRSAPARKMQHLYRILFTLPFALLTTMAIIIEGVDSLFVVLLAITLIVYYLYELITVKNIKSALRSTPILLVVLACCILFTVGCISTSKAVYAGDYEEEDIETIRLYQYASILDFFDSRSESYESVITNKVQIPDKEAHKIISDALSYTIDYEQDYTDINYDIPMRSQYVEIALLSGKTVGRRIRFTMDQYTELTRIIQSSAEYKAAFITLPDSDTIQQIDLSYARDLSAEDKKRLWDAFAQEYDRLTDDEKLDFKQTYGTDSDMYYEHGYVSHLSLEIHLRGSIDSKEYYARYRIPEEFTETRKVYSELIKSQQDTLKGYLESFIESSPTKINLPDMGDLYWAGISLELYVNNNYYTHYFEWYSDDRYPRNEFDNAKDLYTLLLPYLTNDLSTDSHCSISFNGDGSTKYFYNNTVFGIRDLTSEELAELIKAISGETLIEDPEAVKKELNGFVDGMYDSFFEKHYYTNYMLQFSYDGEIYMIDNQIFKDNWSYVDVSKEIVTLMLPYLSESTDTDSTVEVMISYSNEKYSTVYNYIYTFGWNEPEEDIKTKLSELLAQLQQVLPY